MASPILRKTILFVVILAVGIGGAAYYWLNRFKETTDDAVIEAHVVPISAKLSGYITKVSIVDNQLVKQGEVLAQIDPVDFQIAVDHAKAQEASAEAQLQKAQDDLNRQNGLTNLARSQQQLSDASSASKNAEAMVDQAKAGLAAAERDLNNATITAPFDGRVTQRGVEVGEFVTPGVQLMAIVSNDLWVVANYKETQLTRMHAGQPATITIDAYPKHSYRAHVDSIQSGSGARFSMFPPENATGNFVKIVQRVPVKIVFDEMPAPALALGPGMSVVPTVVTHE